MSTLNDAAEEQKKLDRMTFVLARGDMGNNVADMLVVSRSLGNDEFNLKAFDKAIEHYSEAIRLDPENHVYYSNRSAAYGAMGNWVQAEADANECVTRNPQFAKGYHRLANAQKQLGRSADAIATLQRAQTTALDGQKNPAIKKLLRELNEGAARSTVLPATTGNSTGNTGTNRTVPAHIASELQELQPQFVAIQREVEQLDAKLAACARQMKRAALVAAELAQLPATTRTFASVGKMFLQTTASENELNMKADAKTIDDQVASLEARKNYLMRQKTSLEENITELLAQSSTS